MAEWWRLHGSSMQNCSLAMIRGRAKLQRNFDANSFNERDAHSRPDCGSRVSRAAVQRVGSGSRHQWKLNWQLESTCAWRPACHDVAEDHCIRRRSIPARQGPSGYPAGSHVSATYVETFLDRFVSEEEPDAEDDSLRESFTDRSTG